MRHDAASQIAQTRTVNCRACLPLAIPQAINQRWSLDFVSDQPVSGRRFRILAVIGDFDSECLAAAPDTSLPGLHVIRKLAWLIALRGKPAMIVSDNVTELTSNAGVALIGRAAVRVTLHRAGQADAERLHRKLHRPVPRRVLE